MQLHKNKIVGTCIANWAAMLVQLFFMHLYIIDLAKMLTEQLGMQSILEVLHIQLP